MRPSGWKVILVGAVCWQCASLLVAADGKPVAAADLKTAADRASYMIGRNIAKTFKDQSMEVNPDAVFQGFRDAFKGAPSLVSDKDAEAAIEQFQTDAAMKLQERAKVEGEKNKKEGAAFLAANGKKPDVKTLPSGLEYKVLVEGKGRKPRINDGVKADYRGTLIDGTEFDSSYKRGEPAVFELRGVIPGWTEALAIDADRFEIPVVHSG